MDGCKVGIITRTKNRSLLLRRALRSVMNQSYKNYVHIIINDGGDPQEVQKVITEEDAFTSLCTTNSFGHMEKATNEGVHLALRLGATHITLLDDDDTWSDEYLNVMTRELQYYQSMSPTIKGIVCRSNIVHEKLEGKAILCQGLESHNSFLPEIGILPFNYLESINRNFGVNQFLYSADVLSLLEPPIDKSMGPYAESFPVYGDWEFNLRFMRVADIALIPNFLSFYHHRPGDNSVKDTARAMQHAVYQTIIQNHYERARGYIMEKSRD